MDIVILKKYLRNYHNTNLLIYPNYFQIKLGSAKMGELKSLRIDNVKYMTIIV